VTDTAETRVEPRSDGKRAAAGSTVLAFVIAPLATVPATAVLLVIAYLLGLGSFNGAPPLTSAISRHRSGMAVSDGGGRDDVWRPCASGAPARWPDGGGPPLNLARLGDDRSSFP
jgi:hypothetical protein